MPRLIFSLPLLLALALPLSAFSSSPDGPDEDAVRAAIAEYFSTFNAHDADAHAALFADGATFYWANGDSAALDDRAAFLAIGRQWHQQMAALRVQPDGPAEIRFVGDDVATASVLSSASMGDAPMGQVHTLFVLHRTPDGWTFVAEHQAVVRPSDG